MNFVLVRVNKRICKLDLFARVFFLRELALLPRTHAFLVEIKMRNRNAKNYRQDILEAAIRLRVMMKR